MPYKVVASPDGTQHCVHKVNPDGSQGANMGCSDSADMAMSHMKALYANEPKAKFTPEEQIAYQEYLQAKAYIDTHEIKGVIETSDGDVIIPVSAVRFSDPANKDLHQEFFDAKTNYGNPAATEVLPVYLDHGYDKVFITRELIKLGYSEADALKTAEEISVGQAQQGVAIRDSVDAENIYYNVVVNRRNRYKNLLKRLAEEKLIAPSTGVKFRSAKSQDGYISDWHLGELTLTPTGAEPNIGVVTKMADETPTTTVAATPPPEEPKKEEPVVTQPTENPLLQKFAELFPQKADGTQSSPAEILVKLMEKIDSLDAKLTIAVEQATQANKMAGQTHEVMPMLMTKIAENMIPAVSEHMKLSEREKALGVTGTPQPKPNGAPKGLPNNAPGVTR